MISLSGGLKTTGYYAKASRPCGRFPWWICCPRVSLRSTPGYLFATLSRASHDVRGCPLPIDWDGMLRAGKHSFHKLAQYYKELGVKKLRIYKMKQRKRLYRKKDTASICR